MEGSLFLRYVGAKMSADCQLEIFPAPEQRGKLEGISAKVKTVNKTAFLALLSLFSCTHLLGLVPVWLKKKH